MFKCYEEQGISLTQNSYGFPLSCPAYKYFTYSPSDINLDWLVHEQPFVLHVFSAGNSQQACPAETGAMWGVAIYGSTTKRSKNTINVGAVSASGEMTEFSLWGPLPDGRLFPTVCAKGKEVYSLGTNNAYDTQDGTSMACPTASGSIALVAQRYRQLHKGKDIQSDLLKACVVNSAVDAGRKGPDFQFRYGILNVEKAVETIENEYYREGQIGNGEEVDFSIDVPAGAKELRVMLYWHDDVAMKQYGFSEKVLINDLDLRVNGQLPLVLNPTRGKVEELAKPGEDHLNNQEQVVIENPRAGAYTVKVKGHEVPSGAQRFVLVWYIEKPGLRTLLTRGEKHTPGSSFQVALEGISGTGYRVDLSLDGGNSWTDLGSVEDYSPLVNWMRNPLIKIPKDAPITDKALIRIVCSDGASTTSEPFTIAPRPKDLTLEGDECGTGNYMLHWEDLPAASEGFVVLLGDAQSGEFKPIGFVGAGESEYAVAPQYIKQGNIISVAAALKANSTARYGKRAIGVLIKATSPVELRDGDLPFEETFMRFPRHTHFSATLGEQMESELLYSSIPSLPLGSNIFGFASTGDIDPSYTKASASDPHAIFDWSNPANKANMAALTLCDLNLTKLTQEALLHISCFMMQGYEEKPENLLMRVTLNGQPLSSTSGESIFDGQVESQEIFYRLDKNARGTLKIEFIGISIQDAIGFTRVAIDPIPQGHDIALALSELPKPAANRGEETIEFMIANNSQEAVAQTTVRVLVNGTQQKQLVVKELKPFEIRYVEFSADFSTQQTLGEKMQLKISCDAEGDMTPENNEDEGEIINLGRVYPLALPTLSYALGSVTQSDPKETKVVKPGQKIIFTDNGGALQDYLVPQKSSTVKFVPEDQTKSLQVRFTQFETVEGAAALGVYTNDVPKDLKLEGLAPHSYLMGGYTDEIVISSEAADGALTFHLEAYDVGSGWLAEIYEVDRNNPLSIVAVKAVAQGNTPTYDVPIEVTVKNKWAKALDGLTLICRTADNRYETQQELQTIGANEEKVFTLHGLLDAEAMQPQNIVVTLQCHHD